MSETLLRKLWDVERTIQAEQKEFVGLIIELAKTVYAQQKEIDELKRTLAAHKPSLNAAALLVPIGGKP